MPILKECDQIEVEVTCHQGGTMKHVHLSFHGRLDGGRAGVRVTEPIGPVTESIPLDDVQAIVRAFLGQDVYLWRTPIGSGVYPIRNQTDKCYELRDTEEPQG